ncbi:MAG: hypothetical protein DRI65_06605 [Chloroflexota bacterium]|nr:MAG: hypothetical protein DRI65_06605 [Chloroflexota bacterium]
MNKAYGMRVQCSKYKGYYNVYTDIQRIKDGNIYGMCPYCGDMEGNKLISSKLFVYNNGNVKSKLNGEGSYDWSWTKYKKGAVKPSDNTNAFDQDADFLAANLGWA